MTRMVNIQRYHKVHLLHLPKIREADAFHMISFHVSVILMDDQMIYSNDQSTPE